MVEPDAETKQVVSLRLSLLDAQVVDADDLPVGRIDDLDLEVGEQTVEVAEVLIGQRHLGPRVGGLTGRFLAWSARRLARDGTEGDGGRVDAGAVASWSGLPQLRQRLAELPIAGLETWLSAHVVQHIPGADDEGV